MKFNEELPKKEKPIILKFEHLSKGFNPIISGLYDRNNLDKETKYFLDRFKKNAEFINFDYSPTKAKENRMHNSGIKTYMISSVSEKDKYSSSYFNCTGVIVVGADKETGKNISFLSHQDPEEFLEDKEVGSKFKRDLSKDIDDLKSRCIPGSIDAIFFGGNKEDVSDNAPDENFRFGIDDIDDFFKGPFDEYIKSIKYLNYNIKQKIGFSPVVISGPNDNLKTNDHSLEVYFDNENRRLYIIKPKQEKNSKNEAFEADKVEEQIKKF